MTGKRREPRRVAISSGDKSPDTVSKKIKRIKCALCPRRIPAYIATTWSIWKPPKYICMDCSKVLEKVNSGIREEQRTETLKVLNKKLEAYQKWKAKMGPLTKEECAIEDFIKNHLAKALGYTEKELKGVD